MSVKTMPQTYRTQDGRQFADLADAEQHEELTAAHEAYKKALDAYAFRLALCSSTADGHPFALDLWHTYYRITNPYYGWPDIEEVRFTLPRFILDENDQAVIIARTDPERRPEYRVSELYWSLRGAQEAALAARQARIAEYAADIETLRNAITPSERDRGRHDGGRHDGRHDNGEKT